MTPATERTIHLLRRMVASFTVYHDDLKILAKEHTDYVIFYITCHGCDGPRVCGKRGQHFNALQCLLTEMGDRNRRVYKLDMQDRINGKWEQRIPEQRKTPYDSPEAGMLLDDVLEAIIGPDGWLIEEHIAESETIFRLQELNDIARQLILNPRKESPDKSTVIGSLCAIWKAYGKQEGWKFSVEVP
jgi:predicted RNA-binding protein YlqC (UPF0109 family)